MADEAHSTGWVYFIREGRKGPIKIGYATNPQSRIYNIQCGNPRALRFIGMVPGTMQDEADWHARFARLRIGGEWFRSARELLTAIQALPLIDLPRGVADRGSMEVATDDAFRALMRDMRRLPDPTMDEIRAGLSLATPRHLDKGEG